MIAPRAIKDKNGKITSYQLRAYAGKDGNGKLKPYLTKIWQVPPKMSDKQIKKELQKAAIEFQHECDLGIVKGKAPKLKDYIPHVFELKQSTGKKRRTLESYREKIPRIVESMGDMRISDITARELNDFYLGLSKSGARRQDDKAVVKADLRKCMSEKNITYSQLAEVSELSIYTIQQAVRGKRISYNSAKKIADALSVDINKYFEIIVDDSPLSKNTILDYHRTISMILSEAYREELITKNPAELATAPKAETNTANTHNEDDLALILQALENEPIKWKTMIHLMIVTGARRGEILGLKWSSIDFDNMKILLDNNVLYTVTDGNYQDTPKTKSSIRTITVPPQTIALLKEYREQYETDRNNFGAAWHETGLVFYQTKPDTAGLPMNQKAPNTYLRTLSKKVGFKLNPHAFRHAFVSMQMSRGISALDVSRFVGHSKPSTTIGFYAHANEAASMQLSNVMATLLNDNSD